MKTCIGLKDRVIRIVLGGMLLWVGIYGQMSLAWRLVSLVAGATALATGLIRFCPIRAALRISTSGK